MMVWQRTPHRHTVKSTLSLIGGIASLVAAVYAPLVLSGFGERSPTRQVKIASRDEPFQVVKASKPERPVVSGQDDQEMPKSLDPDLRIDLFASEPDIVTPAGIAVDQHGAVLVIESHTHFRPENYDGPKFDRIRRLVDTDGDHRADEVTNFFEGTTHTMNLAVYHDGSVFVATRSEIFRLHDHDADGVADERIAIVRLETDGNYPHNGLSGFAFDMAGQVYFGFGENLGHDYQLIGSDDTTLSGGGEGGSIYRCAADGSQLTRIATGFWNPFHLCFDDYGRLFAVDNDPDWRPPCRLLHIVEGGDYGYRYNLGRRGTHPYSAWFGNVPGTLGMTAGTGEAPSGVIAYQSNGLPEQYAGDILATSWGIHAIERFRLQPFGATTVANAEIVIKGGVDFRPVGIALAPDGSLFVSDWVKRAYELHGHGRVWRIAASSPDEIQSARTLTEQFKSPHRPASQWAALRLAASEEGARRLVSLMDEGNLEPRLRATALTALAIHDRLTVSRCRSIMRGDPDERVAACAAQWGPLEALVDDQLQLVGGDRPMVAAAIWRRVDDRRLFASACEALESDDAFLRQAARSALDRMTPYVHLATVEWPKSPKQRRGLALVMMARLNYDAAIRKTRIEQMLADVDPDVRFLALRWIGEQKLREFQPYLREHMLADPDIDRLFDAYWATLDLIESSRTGAEYEKRQVAMLDEFIQTIDAEANATMTGIALKRLAHAWQRDLEEALPASLHADFLLKLVSQGVHEAVYVLRDLGRTEHRNALVKVIRGLAPDYVRAVAISGLDVAQESHREVVDNWLASLAKENAEVKSLDRELLTALVGQDVSQWQTELESISRKNEEARTLISRISNPIVNDSAERHQSLLDALLVEIFERGEDTIGDPIAGERIFFHPRIGRCAVCHQSDGRGGRIGPDLSHAGQIGFARLFESVVDPSREIAPQYSAWTVVTSDGRVQTGLLQTERGEQQIFADANGELFRVQFNDIEEKQLSELSIMPAGLLDDLTEQEIRDLFAYLLERD